MVQEISESFQLNFYQWDIKVLSHFILFIIEYFDFKTLTDDGTPSAEDRMRNLEVMAGNAAEYESLEEFLADATLMSSADETAGKDPGGRERRREVLPHGF